MTLVNGAWGQWEAWSFDCPVTCEAGNYSHSRRRKCDSPAPQYGGDNCTANGSNDTDTQQCNTDPCPSNQKGPLKYIINLILFFYKNRYICIYSITF